MKLKLNPECLNKEKVMQQKTKSNMGQSMESSMNPEMQQIHIDSSHTNSIPFSKKNTNLTPLTAATDDSTVKQFSQYSNISDNSTSDSNNHYETFGKFR